MWWPWRQKNKKQRRLVALYDYENIDLAPNFQAVDFAKLRNQLLEIGEIIFSIVFLPPYCVNSAIKKRINNEGFKTVVCDKVSKRESDKIEDTVDIEIIEWGLKFIEECERITDIVVISNDAHMIELIKEAKNRGKTVHLFGTDEISACLRDLVEHVEEVPVNWNF